MNAVDWIVASLLGLAVLLGYRRGLIAQLVSVIGLIAAYILAYRFAGQLAPLLGKWIPLEAFTAYPKYEFALKTLRLEEYVLRGLAFALIFFGAKIVLSAAGMLLDLAAKAPGLNALNRWGGALLCLAEVCLLLLVLVRVLALVPSDPLQSAMGRSKTVPLFMKMGPALLDRLQAPPGKEKEGGVTTDA